MKIVKKGIVYEDSSTFGFAGWPTVGILPSGRIGVTFSGNRLRHVCPFGKTMLTVSSGFEAWSRPAPVVDTAFDDRDGGMAVRGRQVLITSFNNNFAFQADEAQRIGGEFLPMIQDHIRAHKDADEGNVGSCVAISEDGGVTFPVRKIVPVTAPHGPILLRDGRYCYVGRAFTIEDKFKTPGREYNHLPDGIYVTYSDDGYEWTKPEMLFPQSREWLLCEPHVIELTGGELLVQIRAQRKSSFGELRIFQSVSSRNRTEWAPLRDVGVNGAPPHLLRHSSGAIISVFGRRERPFGQYAIVSRDEGQSWSEPILLDGEAYSNDLGYPSTVELPDSALMTVYYQHERAGENNKIEYTVWEL